MSTRYRVLGAALLLMLAGAALVSTTPARAQEGAGADRARVLRTLDLLRRGALQPTDASLRTAAADDTVRAGGAIAGSFTGLRADDAFTVTIVAWSPDSTGGRGDVGVGRVAPDATYRIEGLAPGDYYVTAFAPDYVPKLFDDVTDLAAATLVAVAEGATTEGIDFAMERIEPGTGSIAGTVRADGNGAPIAGAAVYAFVPESPFLTGTALTGRDGTYVVEGLKSGRYVVEVWADGYLGEFFDDAATPAEATLVEVAEPGRAGGVDFGLATGATITGYVRNDAGAPIARAFVQASPPSLADSSRADSAGTMPVRPGGWAETDADGFYRIGGLPAGDYYVRADAYTRWTYVTEWYDGAATVDAATPVHVDAGGMAEGIDFALALPEAGNAFGGRVTDADGRPVAGAFITAQGAVGLPYPDGRGAVWAYATTDRDGYYAVTELPAGSYIVSASAQRGWEYVQRWYVDAATPEGATPVSVAPNIRLGGIDIRLPFRGGSASVSGVVRDAAGGVLAGAYVTVGPRHASDGTVVGRDTVRAVWASGVTDSTGAYRVGDLPAGTYVVQAAYGDGERYGQGWYDGADRPEDATPIVLSDGEARGGVDFALAVRPLYGTVEGTVTDAATGAPLPRAYVELTAAIHDHVRAALIQFVRLYALTDDAGRFRIGHVPEGIYVLKVYADGGYGYYVDPHVDAVGPTPFPLAGGEVAVRDVALYVRDAGAGFIAGTVTTDESDWWGRGLGIEPAAPRSAHPATNAFRDGAPSEAAVVVARPVVAPAAVDDDVYTTVAAPDGTYRLRGLAPGDYVVMAFGPGHVGEYYDDTYDPEQATVVAVDGQRPATGVDFALAPMYHLWLRERGHDAVGAVVYGRVTTAVGDALEGATVYLLDGAETPLAYARTGTDGAFELAGVTPGAYRVFASKVGLAGRYNGGADTFGGAEALAVAGGYVEVNLTLGATGTGVDDEPDVPHALDLSANYPNPFNPATRISFTVPKAGRATVQVFDLLGRAVATLYDATAEPGRRYDLEFRATDLATGVYVYTLQFDGQRRARTMLLVK